jgi:hypothetical protein
VIVLDECQATRGCAYALFDDRGTLHAFYQYLPRRYRQSCFDEIESACLIKRDSGIGEPGDGFFGSVKRLNIRVGASTMRREVHAMMWSAGPNSIRRFRYAAPHPR